MYFPVFSGAILTVGLCIIQVNALVPRSSFSHVNILLPRQGTVCDSQCAVFQEAVNTCTSVSCLCTSTVARGLQNCVTCAVNASPTTDVINTAQQLVNTYLQTCSGAPVAVPNPPPPKTPDPPKDTPKVTPKDTPVQTPNDTPLQTPKDTPAATPKNTPAPTPDPVTSPSTPQAPITPTLTTETAPPGQTQTTSINTVVVTSINGPLTTIRPGDLTTTSSTTLGLTNGALPRRLPSTVGSAVGIVSLVIFIILQ